LSIPAHGDYATERQYEGTIEWDGTGSDH